MDAARGVSVSREALVTASPEGASTSRLQGRTDALAVDVGRAIDRTGWGRLHVREQAASIEGSELPEHARREVVHAAALLPNGRTAEIVARAAGPGEVMAAVRVGHFGDAQAERAFLSTLQKVLSGKPAPVRDARFRLPAGWPGVEER